MWYLVLPLVGIFLFLVITPLLKVVCLGRPVRSCGALNSSRFIMSLLSSLSSITLVLISLMSTTKDILWLFLPLRRVLIIVSLASTRFVLGVLELLLVIRLLLAVVLRYVVLSFVPLIILVKFTSSSISVVKRR